MKSFLYILFSFIVTATGLFAEPTSSTSTLPDGITIDHDTLFNGTSSTYYDIDLLILSADHLDTILPANEDLELSFAALNESFDNNLSLLNVVSSDLSSINKNVLDDVSSFTSRRGFENPYWYNYTFSATTASAGNTALHFIITKADGTSHPFTVNVTVQKNDTTPSVNK